jgi:hypothetical protein
MDVFMFYIGVWSLIFTVAAVVAEILDYFFW